MNKHGHMGHKGTAQPYPGYQRHTHETYPPNEGWLTSRGQPKKQLSELAIGRMTTLHLKGRANLMPKTMGTILHITIAWKKVWRTLSNCFSNPYDTKTWFRCVHRSLQLNSNDKSVNSRKCRLCDHTKESHAHLLTCSEQNTLRRLVLKLLQATGLDLYSFAYPYTWLTCLDAQNKPLNEVQVALITIHWNTGMHSTMTKQKLDNQTFNDTVAMKTTLEQSLIEC
eukprot:699355-Pleurochrysis_carterae.AAC.2